MPGIVHNATLVMPAGGGVQVLSGHSLVFADGTVAEIGPAGVYEPRIAAGAFDEVIRADRRIVTPGFVNTHHHLVQTLTRCLPAAQNKRLFRWLLTLYERWRTIDFEAVHAAAQVAIAELLLHGCTTTVDHFYMFPPGRDVRLEAVLSAADSLGIRLHAGRGAMTLGRSRGGLPPDDCVERDADVLADSVRVLDAYHDPRPLSRTRIDLAPCSPFNVTLDLMRETRDLARDRGVLLHTHLAETLDEERFCLETYGRRPVQLLADLDWLGSDVYLAHCVHVSTEEIALLARTKTAVSHNPVSNLRLGSGIMPLAAMRAAGVRVGLGVDGSSSNDGGNILAAAKSAALSARIRPTTDAHPPSEGQREDGPLLPAAEAFELATIGGAACLHRDELGHLNPGAAADFALFRMDDVALAGAASQDPLAALILCDGPRAERVYVGGRPVVLDGHLVGVDEYRLGERLNTLVAARFR